ncbi:MAG: hypothetical protein PHX61_08645 [Alphaproteobacteria bacterium]|nr:hypothetical protein [Alphaproteobacteria bacterium]
MASNMSNTEILKDPYVQNDDDHASQIRKAEEALVADPSLGVPKIHNNGIYARSNRHYYDFGSGNTDDPKDVEKEKQTKAVQFRQNCMIVCETLNSSFQEATTEIPAYQTWEEMVKNEPYKFVDDGLTCGISDDYYQDLYGTPPPDTANEKDLFLTHDVNPLTGEVRELSDSEKINRKIVHDADQILSDATDINFTSNIIKEVSAQSPTPPLIKTDVKIAENFGSAATPAAPATETKPENKSIMFAKAEPASPFADSPLNFQPAP